MWVCTIHQGGPQFKTHNESFSTHKGKDKNILQHCRDTKARRLPWAAHMCLGDPGLSSDRSTLLLFKPSCHHGGLNLESFLCLVLVLFQCTDLAKNSMVSFPVTHVSGWGNVILQHSEIQANWIWKCYQPLHQFYIYNLFKNLLLGNTKAHTHGGLHGWDILAHIRFFNLAQSDRPLTVSVFKKARRERVEERDISHKS